MVAKTRFKRGLHAVTPAGRHGANLDSSTQCEFGYIYHWRHFRNWCLCIFIYNDMAGHNIYLAYLPDCLAIPKMAS